jgi:hypothetical protein
MAPTENKVRPAKGMSEARRATFAQSAAKLLRRKGPMPTARLLEVLGAEGLSVTEALSVVNHGFAHRLLMRDPADPTGIAAGTVSLPGPRRPSIAPPPPAPSAPPPAKGARGRATSTVGS